MAKRKMVRQILSKGSHPNCSFLMAYSQHLHETALRRVLKVTCVKGTPLCSSCGRGESGKHHLALVLVRVSVAVKRSTAAASLIKESI